MRNLRMRDFFVLLLALGLVFSTVSLLPAARSDTGNCITKCNQDNKPFKDACRNAMQTCKALCKELADPTGCNVACDVVRAACDENAAFMKEQCASACPRGQNESPSDPLP